MFTEARGAGAARVNYCRNEEKEPSPHQGRSDRARMQRYQPVDSSKQAGQAASHVESAVRPKQGVEFQGAWQRERSNRLWNASKSQWNERISRVNAALGKPQVQTPRMEAQKINPVQESVQQQVFAPQTPHLQFLEQQQQKMDDCAAFKRCYRKAANGDVCEQGKLGWRFYWGFGVKKNIKEAFNWSLLAALGGDRKAQYRVATMLERKDPEASLNWCRKAASNNHPAALKRLREYERRQPIAKVNHEDVPVLNEEEMFRFYMTLANQGSAHGQYHIGCLYKAAIGTNKNEQEAVRWLELAAEQDYIEAQLALGEMYEHGLGIPQDLSKAQEWYEKASNLGNARGRYLLDVVMKQRNLAE